MTLLPTIKDFIEENIDLIETEDWEAVLEVARLNFSTLIGHNIKMKSLADFLIKAGFNEVLDAQYTLFDKYVKSLLISLILNISTNLLFNSFNPSGSTVLP